MIRDPVRFVFLVLLLLLLDLSVKDVPFTITNPDVRALIDNCGHIGTAIISWFIVRSCKGLILTDRLVVLESLVCGMLSGGLDVDHFIEARSLSISDATSLPNRPFLHCSSLLIVVFLMMLALSLCYRIGSLHTFSFLCLTAWTTHHLRDGLRHGLWFCPDYETEKIDYGVYLMLLIIVPVVISQLQDVTALILVARSRKTPVSEFLESKRRDSTESERLLMQEV